MNLSDITCMVIDFGLFTEVARCLGRSFRKVYYCNPSWANAFPRRREGMIGAGYDEMEVVLNPFHRKQDVDLYVFPDIGSGWLQVELEAQGKLVWGSRMAEEIEYERATMKALMEKLGLPVGEWDVAVGMEALREHLKEHDDQAVKHIRWRGDFETFKSPTYALTEMKLDQIAWQLGPLQVDEEFLVENLLKDRVEVAIDTWSIDGRIPHRVLYGPEIKGLGYCGKFVNYIDLPEGLRRYDTVMAPILRAYGYRGFYDPEMRVGEDHLFHMIDQCARMPEPPGGLYTTFYKNLPEIILEGARGNCIEAQTPGQWGVELIMHSDWLQDNWQAVGYPEEFAHLVKLRNNFRIEGKDYVAPQPDKATLVGGVVGYGDSPEDAFKMAYEVAGSIEGLYIDIRQDIEEQAGKQIELAQQIGVWVE